MGKTRRKGTAKSTGKTETKAATKPALHVSAPKKTTRSKNDPPQGRSIAEEEGVTYGSETKTARVEIRLTPQQQRSVEEAASILGFRNPTEYIRYTIQENARKVIKDQSILEIAERDRERFMSEITNPETPGKALRDAAKHFKKNFENR